jgi:type IV pilus assembly protein PilN
MAHINLLPWREELRSKRQRDFGITLALAAAFAALGVGAVHLLIGALIDTQNDRNRYLQQEIARVDKIIAEIKDLEKIKNGLLSRMDVIQELQGSRPEVVHLFDELVDTLPDGVYLTKVQQQARGLTVTGEAESNARISSYMRNIDASEWVGDPDLRVIENKEREDTAMSKFELRLEQRAPVKEVSG